MVGAAVALPNPCMNSNSNLLIERQVIIAVVGLGYVGLPLAVEFAKKFLTIGFDRSESKVDSCQTHRPLR